MSEFALLIGGQLREVRELPDRPENIDHKQIEWFPVLREYGEPFSGVENGSYVFRTPDPATLPPPVPESIADWQFFQQLAVMELITEEEAERAVAPGDIPGTILALIDQLPEEAQFPARIKLKGAVTFRRENELTQTIAQLYGFSDEQVDDLFRSAGAL